MPDEQTKLLREMRDDIRAMRRNQEATMSSADLERVKQSQMERAGYQPQSSDSRSSDAPTKNATKFDVSKAPSRRGGG